VEVALKNNYSVRTAMYENDLQRKLKQTAFDIGKTDVMITYGQFNSVAIDNNFTVSQNIPFPTVLSSTYALHQSQLEGSELKLKMTKAELTYTVKQVYEQLLYLKNYRKFLLKQDSIYKEFYRVANVRFQNGEGTLLQKATAESKMQESLLFISQNESDLRMCTSRLQTLMNIVALPLIAEDELKKRAIDVAQSDSLSAAENPFLAWLNQEIIIAQKETSVEKNKILPDIKVGYFNQSLTGYQNINGQDQYFGASSRFSGIQVGLSVPLWAPPLVAKAQALKVQEQIAQSNFDFQQSEIQNEYRVLLQQFSKVQLELSYFENFQNKQAQLIIVQSQKAFKAGEIEYYEHSQNLVQALNIEKDYLKTLLQFNQIIYQLQLITGKI
jgi:cobalt-zinc-cadmium resistance protein CzcA